MALKVNNQKQSEVMEQSFCYHCEFIIFQYRHIPMCLFTTSCVKSIYPKSGSHVVRADFSKVTSHHSVVQPIEQHDHTHIH